MAKEKLLVIKEANLTNNCPECFNQDLKLTFYQKHSYGSLVHKTTDEVTHEIICNVCKSDIYPAKWTDDIERLFNYYEKTVTPEKTSLKFTPLFYGILITVLLIAIGVYLYVEGIIQF